MRPIDLYELYKTEVDKKDIVNFDKIVPILEDIQANDIPVMQQILKSLSLYKRNLCERIVEQRQQNIVFYDENN